MAYIVDTTALKLKHQTARCIAWYSHYMWHNICIVMNGFCSLAVLNGKWLIIKELMHFISNIGIFCRECRVLHMLEKCICDILGTNRHKFRSLNMGSVLNQTWEFDSLQKMLRTGTKPILSGQLKRVLWLKTEARCRLKRIIIKNSINWLFN